MTPSRWSTSSRLAIGAGCIAEPPNVLRRALRKLLLLDAADSVDDLRIPPGNRLERLSTERADQYSIRINDPWRI